MTVSSRSLSYVLPHRSALRITAIAWITLTCLFASVSLASHNLADGSKVNMRVILPDSDTPTTLSRDDLAEMPEAEYLTSTVWTDAVHRYSGVLLRDILTSFSVDVDGGTGEVLLTAMDGYSATLPFHKITEAAPMIAFLRDGEPMPRRGQGPFWLIFPYDEDPAFRQETIYALSVWQIEEIRIRK